MKGRSNLRLISVIMTKLYQFRSMTEWDNIRKEFGSSNGRLLYLETQLSPLLEQVDDLRNEIQSLRMITEDFRKFIFILLPNISSIK